MIDKEVNRVLAEFMGEKFLLLYLNGKYLKWFIDKFDDGNKSFLYTNSLDIQVAVWEKIGLANIRMFMEDKHAVMQFISKPDINSWDKNKEFSSIQQAAAYATAKAIQELNS